MTGVTPWDSVFVFTYKIENTKYHDEATAGNEMAGAGFTLYTDNSYTTAVKLINNNDGTYTVADQTATTGVVTEMVTFTGTGKFDVYGLDAGTYYLKETTTPQGYNTCDVITVTITANHAENAGTEGADLTLTSSTNMANNVVNKAGTVLPSTGGVGTTLFIVFGSIAVVLAGIFLVTNKRMKKEMD
jgi:LPXTG-motif cell wall-anchored protein